MQVLQVVHEPLLQVLPELQLEVVHVVQPMLESIWQVWRWPFALHCAAPAVQTSWQQVVVFTAMVLSTDVSWLWLVAVYALEVPPAEAMASSTALLLPEVNVVEKPTTKTLMPAALSAAAAFAEPASSMQSFGPRLQALAFGVGPQPGVDAAQVFAFRLRLQFGRPSVISNTYAGVESA